eukprot:COSAG01_NODE_7611_length_3127_cov_51.853038_4_plen_91_part_00
MRTWRNDFINGKFKTLSTRDACRASCDANPACVGYSYSADLTCAMLGPGLDTDLAGGWYSNPSPTTTIAGASGSSVYDAYRVCAAVAGRN